MIMDTNNVPIGAIQRVLDHENPEKHLQESPVSA